MKHVLSVRIPEHLAKTISDIAHERGTKPATILREALEFYLEYWSDYKIALDRLNDQKDKILTEKNFLRKLRIS